MLETIIRNSQCKIYIFYTVYKNQKKINLVFFIFLIALFLFSPVSLSKVSYLNIKSDFSLVYSNSDSVLILFFKNTRDFMS